MAYYTFESFHINVGAGDGAIHLLTAAPRNQDPRRVVVRAFMVDGGRSQALGKIQETVRWIEQKHHCPSPYYEDNTSYLMFDAFVITHWDGDHCEGLLDYLKQDLRWPIFANQPDQRYLSRARYSVGNNNVPGQPHLPKTPRSFVYTPWDWQAHAGAFFKNIDGNLASNFNANNNTWMGINLLAVRTGPAALLGLNLLVSGQQDGLKKDFTQMGTLENLLNYNKISPPLEGMVENAAALPAMYCVAAGGWTLTLTDIPQLHHTPKNMSSIAFIVVWEEPNKVTRYITHYFGGDAPGNLEVDLATWMGDYKPASMKLSHHGSASSNPIANFAKWNPKNIVVSAGKQYGHPRWEILFTMDAWFKDAQYYSNSFNGQLRQPFFPCQWPAYTIQNAGQSYINTGFSIGQFDKGSDFYKYVMKAHEHMRDQRILVGQDLYLDNPITIVNAKKTMYRDYYGWDPDDATVKQWICQLVKESMANMCALGDYGIGNAKVGGQQLTFNFFPKTMSTVTAIQVTSTPKGLNEYGQVTVVGLTQTYLRVYKEYPIPPAQQAQNVAIDGVPFPTTCSLALRAAKLGGEKKQAVAYNPYVFKGEDRPMTIDLTTGNPKWPPKSQLKHVDAPGSEPKDHDDSDSWFDILEHDDDWVVPVSSSEEESEEEADLSDLEYSPRRRSKSPKHDTQQAAVVYKKIPLNIKAAAVYLACDNPGGEPVHFPEHSTGYILDKDNPLYGFTDTLHYRGFGLKSVPDKVNATPLDPEDEVYAWLGRFCGWDDATGEVVPEGFSLGMCKVDEWPVDKNKKAKLDFTMTVPYVNGRKLQFSTNTGAQQTFAKVAPSDKVDEKAVTPEALTNMHISRRSLVFGLEDNSAPLKTTLEDVAKFIRLDLDVYPLLRFLSGGVELTLETDKDFHNALWYRPGMEYETILRLQFHLNKDKFNEWLHTLNANLAVDDLLVVARKRASWAWRKDKDMAVFNSSVTFLCRMTVSPSLQLTGAFELSGTTVTLTLTMEQQAGAKKGRKGALMDVTKWLGDKFNVSKASELDGLLNKAADSESGAMDENSILPRRVQIVLDVDEHGKISGINSASIDIEVCLTIGLSEASIRNKMPIVFLFSFGWSEASGFYLKGRLWTVLDSLLAVIPDTPFTPYDRALPEFEEYNLLKPVSPNDPENQERTIDLARLLSKGGQVSALPAGIPNEIYRLEIGISEKQIDFSGAIRCSPPKQKPNSPPLISLEELELDASYSWPTKPPSDTGLQVRLAIAINLYLGGQLDEKQDLEEQYERAAKLQGEVKYDTGAWTIEASAMNLGISHLISFWDVQDRGPLLDFLSKIHIDFVGVKYEFGNKGNEAKTPSNLSITGQFQIAEVAQLTIDYNNPGGDGWTLTSGLGPSEQTRDLATVGKLLAGFIDKDTVDLLPEGIRDAKINGAKDEQAIRIIVAKHKGLSLFACLVAIGKVSVWFLQLRQGDGTTKRLLRAAISKVSVEVPAFQTTLNSPWEDLFFMWVQDTTPQKKAGDTALTGITQQEYENLSEVLKDKAGMSDQDMLLFKPKAKKPDSESSLARRFDNDAPDTSVVIPAGFHLVVVTKGTDGKVGVLFDYLFGAKKATSKMVRSTGKKPSQPDPSGSEKGVKAPYQVKLGPLSVGNIGLWFREGMIGINLDATLLMGPIGISLLGFSIGVPFSGDYSLSKPPPISEVQWGLKGLIVALDRPPLTVAGGFMLDTSMPNIDVLYTGGLVVGFKPWSFEAMGAYATVTNTPGASGWTTSVDMKSLDQLLLPKDDDKELVTYGNNKEFTFAFIFVKMNGPLFSVGFADFAGLVGGFGMNSDILTPTVEQVTRFPFVEERDKTNEVSPVERMQGLMKGAWFSPAEGRYWAAAGARVTAFQMLAANIVLVVQFGNGSLLLGIYGVATCDVPALESPVKFAHVELGIVCTFDAASGVFKLEAQLSPRSFILAPQCHLTGGMALFAWSKDDYSDPEKPIQAGDWVLTIGGYHRAFHPPRAYPKPPRLGISWSLDSSLSVTGEAYFALTPKVCMGGGRIHAALSLGALYAWFDAFMDFLMNFEPFFFQLQARIAVGVRFTLDLWLVTIRINAEISASLDFSGPPFGGVVHVDFWVFGFDIKFGSPPASPPAISLDRFWKVVTKSSTSTKSLLEAPYDVAATAKPDTAAILLTCETGLLPPLQKEKAKPEKPGEEVPVSKWYVKGGKFSMLATFQFVVTSAKLTETRIIKDPIKGEMPEKRYADASIDKKYQEVFAKPMQLTEKLTSDVAVSVTAPRPKTTDDVHIMQTWADQRWKLAPQIKPMQTSIWGRYDRNLDPSVVGGAIDSLLDGKDATMPLVTGLTMVPPDPAPAGDKINKFNVTKDHVSTVYNPRSKNWPLFIGVLKDQDPAWQPVGPSKSWDQVSHKWASVGDATTTKAVDIWAKRLRFDKASVEADQKDEALKGKFKPLRGVSPKKLLDKFDVMVPALPLIAVGC
ncbi:hypothetical protein ACHAPT_008702 [Fusarium lateritium]